MKRIFLLFICFLAVFSIVLPVSAFELGVRGYYWLPELSGVMRVDDAGIVGTELDLENDRARLEKTKITIEIDELRVEELKF